MLPDISYTELCSFLQRVSPYTRKTLGKIQKLLLRRGEQLFLPEGYHSSRLEALSWEDITCIVEANRVAIA